MRDALLAMIRHLLTVLVLAAIVLVFSWLVQWCVNAAGSEQDAAMDRGRLSR